MFGNFKRPVRPVQRATTQAETPAVSGLDGTPAASEAVIKKPQAGGTQGPKGLRAAAARRLMR